MSVDYVARVTKGAALLDEKMPGWVDRIDLETLDISNGQLCVTAQLSGVNDWAEGRRQLDLTEGDGGTYMAHGFNAEEGCECCTAPEVLAALPEGYDQDQAYAVLNGLWRELIEGRRAHALTA